MQKLRFRTRRDPNASPVRGNATIDLLRWLVYQISGGGEYIRSFLFVWDYARYDARSVE